MTHEDFMLLMQFPVEWSEWGMIPDELACVQLENYEEGHENSPEHDRNGAFHWWLKRNPSKAQVSKLLKLSRLDPDQLMAQDARKYIRKSLSYERSMETES